MKRKIIVLTPVKNEEWILDCFLKTTSLFADHIIIADQNSTDQTIEIAKKYPKVLLIENNSDSYDESSRQNLLISTARSHFGFGNIILAIDADEIISYNSLQSCEWESIHQSEPGSILYFEKPTFYRNLDNVIRYASSGGWPLGMVDNGAEHHPSHIHSTRIPITNESPRLYLKEIKFLHFNLLSLNRQRSKIRYYCLLEAIAKTKPWHRRIQHYNRNYNYVKEGDGLSTVHSEWIHGWIQRGIIINEPQTEKFLWYDKECLKLFQNQGSRTFWMEDVWDVDWKQASAFFGISPSKLTPPPKAITYIRDGLYYTLKALSIIKSSVKHISVP